MPGTEPDTDDGRRFGGPGGALYRPGEVVERRPVLSFFVLTFAYSWGLFGLLYLLVGGGQLGGSRWAQIPFAWGPPLAAAVVVRTTGGDVRAWLTRLADPRTNPAWYFVAVLLGFLLADTGSVLAAVAGVPLELAQPPVEVVTSFAVSLLFAGALEEVGWRGFVQTRLQERHDALVGAVVVGLGFGLWHTPWVFLGGASYGDGGVGALAVLTFFGVLMSVIRAWLFNASGGALPVVMLTHATVNTGSVFEPAGATPNWLPQTQLGLFLWIGLAVMLVLVYGREYLAPRGPGFTYSRR